MKSNIKDKDFLTFGNMRKALRKSCNNVRWKASVTSFEMNGLKNTIKTMIEIDKGKYKLLKYSEFTITEPKERNIKATRIRDRQVQRCLCDNYLYAAFTRSFIYDNCACQVGKGTDFALNRLKVHLQKQYRKSGNDFYYLKCDIHHFFESINHEILKEFVKRQIDNRLAIDLTFQVIDSFGKVGLGLGSQLSQLLALLFLNEMDHIIKEKLHIKHFIRYMDDFILLCDDKDYLLYCRDYIGTYLQSIGLELNRKTTIQHIKRGLSFLNWNFRVMPLGKIIMVHNKKRLHSKCRKIRKMINLFNLGKISYKSIEQSINGIIAHLSKGNSYRVICEFRRYLNMCENKRIKYSS